MKSMDKYRIRAGLLMEAMDAVGVCSPQDAVGVWAEGLRKRSAALQYSVMDRPLKAEYAKDLEQTFPNWVTGVSSPWVDRYEAVKAGQADGGNWSYMLRFHLMTSAGPAGDYLADLTVSKDGEFWCISKVTADRELSAYTGFIP
jgi:hypothetical protein